MSDLVEGIWSCTVLGGEAAADDKDIMRVRINVQITEGPDKGRRTTYEDQINNKSAKYIAQSAKSAGWSGRMPIEQYFREDVDQWVKETGGASTVEIKHVKIKQGKQFDKWVDSGMQGNPPIWAKASSIGRGNRPLKPPSAATSADANEAMRAALADGGAATSGPDTGGSYSGGYDDAPPPADDDIPFISNSMRYDRVRAW